MNTPNFEKKNTKNTEPQLWHIICRSWLDEKRSRDRSYGTIGTCKWHACFRMYMSRSCDTWWYVAWTRTHMRTFLALWWLLHLKILLALDFRKYLKSMWRSWSAVPLCAYWYGHHMCHCSDFFQRVCITMSLDLWHLTCCIKEFSYQNGWRMSDPHLMSDCNSSPGSIVCRNHHCVRKASSNSIYCLFALHSKKMFNTHALPSLLH